MSTITDIFLDDDDLLDTDKTLDIDDKIAVY